jgi:hypothetical protein
MSTQPSHHFEEQKQVRSEQQPSRDPPPSPASESRFLFQQAAPVTLKGNNWQLQPMQMANAALIYEAYLTNPDAPIYHHGRFRNNEAYTWHDHVNRVQQAEKEHHACKSFSFALLSTAQNKCLGCLHLSPLRPSLVRYRAPDDVLATIGENRAMVLYWICRSHRKQTFSRQFIQPLHHWLSQVWELEGHLFRVNAEDFTAVHALQAVGLTLRFSLDVAVRPGRYAFYGE